MSGRREDTVRRILDMEERVHRTVGLAQHESWLDSELGTSQIKVLLLLRALGDQRIGDIGRALGVKKASVSETVERMAGLGLVARKTDQTDRRSIRVSLTESGREQSERMRAAGGVRTARLLAMMDEVELDHVRLGLEAMGRAAERLNSDEVPADRSRNREAT